MRSAVAVLLGLVVNLLIFFISTLVLTRYLVVPGDVAPDSTYLALNFLAIAFAAAAGGATAMRFAPHAPHGHVWVLAFVILLLSLSTILAPLSPGFPAWYRVLLTVAGPLFVVLGGLLADRTRPHTER